MPTLYITPGETGRWSINVTDASGDEQPLTLLVQAWLTLKRRFGDADPGVFQLTLSGSEIAVTDSLAGEMEAIALSAKTALLGDGERYFWDCRLKFSDGTISNPSGLRGELVAEARVTHAL